jgi:uroporphyrinogen-III synthase
VVPTRADARGAAEAIIAASGGRMSGARVLVARASGGREEAVARLSGAGAEVETISLYRSEPIEPDDATARQALERLRDGEIDVVALFAPSQVRALFDLLGDGAAGMLARCRAIAAIGETTRAELASRGVRVDVVPRAASGPALAEALAAHLSQEAS